MADYFQILCGIAVALFSLYYYLNSKFDFWKNRDISGPQPRIIVGTMINLLFRRKAACEQIKEWYDTYKTEPAFGIYEGTSPILVINDLEMIKDVLIRDFSLFVDRGFRIYPKIEPLTQHLFLLEAERWRPLRTKLSPIFTSGKLKEMYPLMYDCGQDLQHYLDKRVKIGEPIECKELTAKFTIDVIGNCIFGINMNAISDEECEFRRMGRKVFTPTIRTSIKEALRQFAPNVYEIIGGSFQQKDVETFFINVISDTIDYRRKNKVVRPDFINMLMQLQDHPEKIDNIELTTNMLAAQAFVFFAAGFETSSSTIAHCIYELAQNQDVQDKLRKEVREYYEKRNGTWTYEDIKDMPYLDKVFKETLRKYPLVPTLMRKSSENYTFKGTKLTIPKDTAVWIPVFGIQRNEAFYPEPMKFDPERFAPDVAAARHSMSYLPFGDGPRNCIGARFAHYQTKLGIISVIKNFKVDVCEKTVIPYNPDRGGFIVSMREIYLNFTKV